MPPAWRLRLLAARPMPLAPRAGRLSRSLRHELTFAGANASTALHQHPVLPVLALMLGRSRRTHKAIQHLLQPRMLEEDLELVAFLRDDLAVAELAVEHALAELKVGAALVAEGDG